MQFSSLALDASARRLSLTEKRVTGDGLRVEALTARYRPDSGLSAKARVIANAETLDMNVTAKRSAKHAQWRVEATLRGDAGKLHASGGIGDDTSGKVKISAEGSDLGRLLAFFDLRHETVHGPWRGSMHVAVDGDALVFAPLEVNAEAIDKVSGDARLTRGKRAQLIAGSGSLDLRTEAIDLMLAPRPKQRVLLGGSTPIHISGTLSEPSVSVATGALVISSSTLLLGAVNPYLLLGAISPAFSRGDTEATCKRAVKRAVALAKDAPAEVTGEATKLQESHSGTIGRILTAPFRALRRLGPPGETPAASPAPDTGR